MDLDFSTDVIERLLFKQILRDKKYLGIMSSIFDKRWFKIDNIALLFKVVLSYNAKYDKVPSQDVIVALIKKYAEKHNGINITEVQTLLSDIINMELNISEDVLNTNLKEYIRKRALFFAVFDNVEKLDSNSDAVIDDCLARFDKVQKISFNDADIGMNYFDPETMKQHWEYIKNPGAKIPTGWKTLDKYTNGGFLKDGKSLYIFMGQAGLGKSLFLSNIAVNFLRQNLSVVVVSLEMSQDVYATRFDAHISTNNINRLGDDVEGATRRIKEFYTKYPKANLYIKEYPPRSITSTDIATYLENLKNAGKHFDIIIIDYLNLVLPQRKTTNMYQDGLIVSEKLRSLSYKFNVPVITAVQANSEGMNNENLGMENISESRGIAHTGDLITALYQMPEDRENGIIKARILKNRLGGRVGSVLSFKMDSENLILNDVTFDEAATNPSDDDFNKVLTDKSLMNNPSELDNI